MRLFTELRRRNVLRMAALYVVAAWLVMQVAGVLIDLGALTENVGPWILSVLAIGFPIALLASWIFEITPEGVSLEKDIPEGQSITHVTGRRMDFVVIALLCAAVILFAADKWWPREPLELSIAVLPFENMSDDSSQEYFSDGISEEILNLLAQIGPLKVIARTSSFSFKDKDVDIATIAEQLDVRHVLEGSVRRSGDQVRITAQLIDATDSSHLWSQTYDREYSAEDLFAIQSDVARSITNRLRMTLTETEEERLDKAPTENTEAYTAYLLGRDRLRDRKVADMGFAVEQFSLAVELDRNFAGAWSGLSDACLLFFQFTNDEVHDSCPAWESDSYLKDLEALARKAIELDPELGEGYVSLGILLRDQASGNPDDVLPLLREAHAAYERGLELSPNVSQAYNWYAMSLPFIGYYPDPPHGWIDAYQRRVWQSVIDKGLEVDPLSVPLLFTGSQYPLYVSTPEEAMQRARRAIEIAPESPRGYERVGSLSDHPLGRVDEAIRWVSEAARRDPMRTRGFVDRFARYYLQLGDYEKAREFYAYAAPGRDKPLADAIALLYLDGRAEAIEALETKYETILENDGRYDNLIGTAVTLVALDLKMGDIKAAVQRIDTLLKLCLEISDFESKHCYFDPMQFRVSRLNGQEEQFRPAAEDYYRDVGIPWHEAYGSRARQ